MEHQKKATPTVIIVCLVIGIFAGIIINSIMEKEYNCYIDDDKIYDFGLYLFNQMPDGFKSMNVSEAENWLIAEDTKVKSRIKIARLVYNLC